MYPAFQAILDSQATDSHLLFSFLYFLRHEDDGATDVDIDVPIKDLFTSTVTETAMVSAIMIFELHHGLNIPDDYCDWNVSIREFLKRVAELPRISPEEYRKHLHEMKRTSLLADRKN